MTRDLGVASLVLRLPWSAQTSARVRIARVRARVRRDAARHVVGWRGRLQCKAATAARARDARVAARGRLRDDHRRARRAIWPRASGPRGRISTIPDGARLTPGRRFIPPHPSRDAGRRVCRSPVSMERRGRSAAGAGLVARRARRDRRRTSRRARPRPSRGARDDAGDRRPRARSPASCIAARWPRFSSGPTCW